MKNSLCYFLIFLALALGALVGFFVGSGAASQEEGIVVSDEMFSVDSSFLANPILYEWWASAEGKLKEKRENSFILVVDENILEIEVHDRVSGFSVVVMEEGLEGPTKNNTPIRFLDIPIGSHMRGGVLLSRKGTLGIVGKENAVVAQHFDVFLPAKEQ